jgi:hypothetical protein
MSKFNKKDMELLSEAYTLRLLKEEAPSMTLEQIQNRLQYMTESEAEYIGTVCDRITEAFGGLGSLGKAFGNITSGLGGKIKGVGRGALEVGKNLKSNIQDIHQSGKDVAESQGVIKKAQSAAQQLIDLVTQAKAANLIAPNKDIIDMSLDDIIFELDSALQSRKKFEQDALKKGFMGGGLGAFKKAGRLSSTGSFLLYQFEIQ